MVVFHTIDEEKKEHEIKMDITGFPEFVFQTFVKRHK